MADGAQSQVRQMFEASVHALNAERYELRGWAGGFRIYDRGELISTIHGNNWELAGKLFRMLRDEERRAV